MEANTTTRYWHIADASFEEGSDLVCFSDRFDAGEVTLADWRWDHEFEDHPYADESITRRAEDSFFVSLWATREEVQSWLDFGGAPANYKLLAVDIDESKIVVFQAPEGHPAVMGRIPWTAITVCVE